MTLDRIPVEDARNLAAARIIIALHAAWILLSRDPSPISDLPRIFWSRAPGESAHRFLLVPGMAPLEEAIRWIVLVALLLVAMGITVRVAALVAAAGLYHLAPLATILATPDPINRGFTIAVLCLGVLAASPCAERWSVRPGGRGALLVMGWPLWLMRLFVAEIYLFGVIGKFRVSGPAWFSADNLRRNLELYLYMHPEVHDSLVEGLSAHTGLMRLGALMVLVLESSFLLAVCFPRSRRLLVPSALAFHLIVLRTMRIVFANIAHLGLFVNWAWLADQAASLASSERAARKQPVPPRNASGARQPRRC